jgi:hypothetical protein
MSRHADYPFVARRRREYFVAVTVELLLFIACVEASAIHVAFALTAIALGAAIALSVMAIDELSDDLKTLDKGWDQ